MNSIRTTCTNTALHFFVFKKKGGGEEMVHVCVLLNLAKLDKLILVSPFSDAMNVNWWRELIPLLLMARPTVSITAQNKVVNH